MIEYKEIRKMVLDAFEKQISKKTEDCSEEGYVECPSCKSCTNACEYPETIKYCFNCGQRMKVTRKEAEEGRE
jgi:acetyl-CoA carboxylase beta subunit